MNIVAFTGKRGHGKSTAAEALVREHGYVHLNFADPLREVCHIVYGVSYEEMLDPVLKETVLDRWPFKAPRELLQYIGTDMFRKTKFADEKPLPETWVESWCRKTELLLAGGASGVVCSDCRFLNEAAVIKSIGGRLIRITDPRKDHQDAASLHISEKEIDQIPVDHSIVNGATIAALEAAALFLVTERA